VARSALPGLPAAAEAQRKFSGGPLQQVVVDTARKGQGEKARFACHLPARTQLAMRTSSKARSALHSLSTGDASECKSLESPPQQAALESFHTLKPQRSLCRAKLPMEPPPGQDPRESPQGPGKNPLPHGLGVPIGTGTSRLQEDLRRSHPPSTGNQHLLTLTDGSSPHMVQRT
jgi:hypothetical protein